MALTPKDGYQLMTLVMRQATAQSTLAEINASTWTSSVSKIMETGMENVFNALHLTFMRTMIASRPYSAKLTLMEEINTGVFSARLRKISYYSKFPKASGEFNTDLFTNLKDGYTNGQNKDAEGTPQSTKSQWEQNQAMPLELFFNAGGVTWQFAITMYEDQVQTAFESVDKFNAFVMGYVTEHQNDIESTREAWNRMCLLNKIASVYDMSASMPGSVVNLTAEYNARFGTSYTRDELLSAHLQSFLEFFVAKIKKDSARLEERSANYHWSVPKTVGDVEYKILRHTPKDAQRVYLYHPLFVEAESMVLPTIFNKDLLKIENYEPIEYWQSNDTEAHRSSIDVTPSVTNTETGVAEPGARVQLPYVVGMITDKDGLMTNMQLETARTTSVEARKGYRNTWLTFLKSNYCDNTENAIIYYLG